MQLNGIHHVTAVSARIGVNYDFYTRVLGLRLVKRSVNQDDVSAYHLFYADKVGTPGTDMTFFDWAHIGQDRRGTDSISTTAFRVHGRAALEYWSARLRDFKVSAIKNFAGRDLITFEDPEGQRLALVDDQGAAYEGVVWDQTDVPAEFALRGFYAVMLSSPQLEYLKPILMQVLDFREQGQHANFYPDGGEVTIFAMGEGGAGREIWVALEPNKSRAQMGAGGVHHLALRVANDEEQRYWRERITKVGLPVSEFIDRFYFKSIYFRVSMGILFEIATDGPGFHADEDLATLGERLALPPFLEPQRAQIEANLKPIVPPANPSL